MTLTASPTPGGGVWPYYFFFFFFLQNDHQGWGQDYLDPLPRESRHFTRLLFIRTPDGMYQAAGYVILLRNYTHVFSKGDESGDYSYFCDISASNPPRFFIDENNPWEINNLKLHSVFHCRKKLGTPHSSWSATKVLHDIVTDVTTASWEYHWDS